MNIQSPAVMAVLRGLVYAVIVGLVAFFNTFDPDLPDTLNNALTEAGKYAVGALALRFGVEGIYDQVRANIGKISTADVVVAALREGSTTSATVVNATHK